MFRYWTYVALALAAILGVLGFEIAHGALAAVFEVGFAAALVMSIVFLAMDMGQHPSCSRTLDTLSHEEGRRFRHWTVIWLAVATVFGLLGLETSPGDPFVISRGGLEVISLNLSLAFRALFIAALVLSIISLVVDLVRYGPCPPPRNRAH